MLLFAPFALSLRLFDHHGVTRRDATLGLAVATTARPPAPDAALLAEGDAIVRSLWLGRLAYPALVASLEIGLFEAVASRSLSSKALSERLGVEARAVEALTATCGGLGLLECSQGSWSIPQAVRPLLLKSSPFFFGPQLLAADGTHASLRRALAGGARRSSYQAHSAASVESFIASMEAHSRTTAQCAATHDFSDVERLLDMAGGSGCFARAIARNHPKLHATVADVPIVANLLHKYVEPDVKDRVRAVDADLFAPWPQGHDGVLLANVLHDWGPDEAKTILANAFECLPAGGRCFVVEALMNDDGAGPLSSGLYSISMLLGDWRTGKQYSHADLVAMLEKAGFADVKRSPRDCGAFHSMLIAQK